MIRVLEEEETEPKDLDISILFERRLLHPTGRYKVAWDFFIGIIILFSVLVVPVEICFNEPAFELSDSVTIVINVFFFLDIVASFFTAYISPSHDALVLSHHLIAKNYLKTWFFIDFFSSVPFDQIFAAALHDSSANLSFTKLLKVIRLFRLLKMARVLKLSTYLDTIEDTLKVPPAFFQLLTLLFQVYFIAHLIACVFWGLASSFPIDKESTLRWYDFDTGFFAAPVANGKLFAKYLVSIYFTFTTITTVGYGDIYPQNVYERLLGIFIGIIGASIFGYTLANVSGAVNSLSSGNSAAKERMVEVIEYLKEKQCPKPLAAKVVNHFYRKLGKCKLLF
ncbi:hypothetical protein EON65_08410 [archaeon]|nr:MAG: hypothetical protein EON65_08410 [archaeon]